MKIATFNINNVNRRLPNLLAWLNEAAPDAVCLQELKASDAEFPAAAIHEAGYRAVWQSQRTWNGVAILARKAKPVLTRRSLPGDPADKQSRYIEAAVEGVLIGCLYLPNGNPQPGPKFAYKLAWFNRLIAHAAELHATGLPVVLAGDYNVVPTDQDIYHPGHGSTTRFSSPKAAPRLLVWLIRGGPMPFAPATRSNQSIHSGTTSMNDGPAMLDCGSTISCSAPPYRSGSQTLVWIARCGEQSVPATMLRLGWF